MLPWAGSRLDPHRPRHGFYQLCFASDVPGEARGQGGGSFPQQFRFGSLGSHVLDGRHGRPWRLGCALVGGAGSGSRSASGSHGSRFSFFFLLPFPFGLGWCGGDRSRGRLEFGGVFAFPVGWIAWFGPLVGFDARWGRFDGLHGLEPDGAYGSWCVWSEGILDAVVGCLLRWFSTVQFRVVFIGGFPFGFPGSVELQRGQRRIGRLGPRPAFARRCCGERSVGCLVGGRHGHPGFQHGPSRGAHGHGRFVCGRGSRCPSRGGDGGGQSRWFRFGLERPVCGGSFCLGCFPSQRAAFFFYDSGPVFGVCGGRWACGGWFWPGVAFFVGRVGGGFGRVFLFPLLDGGAFSGGAIGLPCVPGSGIGARGPGYGCGCGGAPDGGGLGFVGCSGGAQLGGTQDGHGTSQHVGV
mmetsp:Transcript_10401/g.63470  ORF Transcript_10401/g.63470 Transcript_10401/m.63470 type:complete len:409 (-) Transcript_10401:8516-9742(-)